MDGMLLRHCIAYSVVLGKNVGKTPVNKNQCRHDEDDVDLNVLL